MSRGTPTQTNFNGGELSRRLHARFDLNLYDIGLAACAGWVPLPEGGLDACPGTIRVEAAAGPCRLIPFEYNATQGYLIEMSAGLARFYTNDARIERDGVPVELELPYDKAAIDALSYEPSYDVLYLFHGAHDIRTLTRIGADDFELSRYVLEGGPFETRNKDESVTVSTSGVSGDVQMAASEDLFDPGDVGGLFQVEADDFGDISSWEPGITVALGQLLTWSERVYRVVGGSGRTGTVAPIHGDGIEWDGIGAGQDVNKQNAGGVQLEYVCDRFGVLRITGYVSATEVEAEVLRRLPFTAATSYGYEGGYYDPDWDGYEPPEGAVTYQYGTWRWRFGAFSPRRGFPDCGVVWNERLILAKGSTLYASVAGDLPNFATYNELGDVTADMAFVATVKDPNGIIDLVADDDLLILTASGMFSLIALNPAAALGPGNVKDRRENNEGIAPNTVAVELDGRTLYVGKSRRRVIEGAYGVQRNRQEAIDLSRYARHIGQPRFLELVSQKDPNRLVWARRGDGSLAVAAYVPDEQVLGWATRLMAAGAAVRSIAGISDPAGELNQLWMAIEYRDAWHVARLDQFRQEDDPFDPVMTDLSVQYEGPPATTFGPVPWLADRVCQVWADDRLYRSVEVDADGMFTLPDAATRVNVGLPYPASFTTLPISSGGENGPAMAKTRRISRSVMNVLKARGLQISVQGNAPRDIEQLFGDSSANDGFAPDTGIIMLEDCGEWDRLGQVTVTRVAPAGATVRAYQPTVDVSPR